MKRTICMAVIALVVSGLSAFGQQPFDSSVMGQQPFDSLVMGQQPIGSSSIGQQPFDSSVMGQQSYGPSATGQQPFGSSPMEQQHFDSSPVREQSSAPSTVGQQVYEQHVSTQSEPEPLDDSSRTEILDAMKRATQYMMDSVSCQGGFVWAYLLDHSRCWGEIEAKKTMIWLQSPGTPAMGELMMDAYHATGDEYYYEAAMKIAKALQQAQHPSGGWNYVYDFDGEESLKGWYRTIGASAWRLEEFQHYYGNATFDDGCTTDAASFLLRLYMEKHDSLVLASVEKAIKFILDSQYPCGGWPQRYPLMYDHPFRGKADYSSFITLNDEVLVNNVEFLQKCNMAFDKPELGEAATKGMYLLIDLQQPSPLAGWADQYTPDLKPAHARSYEPRSVNTGTTVGVIRQLFRYYLQTGDSAFIQGIPSAIEFLENERLSQREAEKWGKPLRDPQAFFVPRFIDPDSGKPLYVHRKGGNVCNGYYYTDQDITHTIGHYSSVASVNTVSLREELRQIQICPEDKPLTDYHHVAALGSVISSLSPQGCWITPLRDTSNPYLPCEGQTTDDADYCSTMAGDKYDTSPYPCTENIPCISLKTFIFNMRLLIRAVAQH